MTCVIRHRFVKKSDDGVIYTFSDGSKLRGECHVCEQCGDVRFVANEIEEYKPPIPDAIAQHNARRLSPAKETRKRG